MLNFVVAVAIVVVVVLLRDYALFGVLMFLDSNFMLDTIFGTLMAPRNQFVELLMANNSEQI
jgi:hypothetical protein